MQLTCRSYHRRILLRTLIENHLTGKVALSTSAVDDTIVEDDSLQRETVVTDEMRKITIQIIMTTTKIVMTHCFIKLHVSR